MLTSRGFEVLAEDRVRTRPSMLKQMNDLHLLSLLDVPSGLSMEVDMFKKDYFDSLAKESESGSALVDSFRVIVARRVL